MSDLVTPITNDVPHYIVMKQGKNKKDEVVYQDLSGFVSGLSFTSDIGNFPSTQLDLIPLPGVGLSGGVLILSESIYITRNDRILVLEVDEEGYNTFKGKNEKEREIPNGIFVMWGIIADVMSARAADRHVVSVILESELAQLDTTLTQEVIGARGGSTYAPILQEDIDTKDIFGAVNGINVTALKRLFITDFLVGNAPSITQDATKYTSLYSETKPLDNLKLASIEIVKPMAGANSNRLEIQPWPLVRLVVIHAIKLSLPPKSMAKNYGLSDDAYTAMIEKMKNLIALMCLIEAPSSEDQNTKITLSINEYSNFITTLIINPIVKAPSSTPSIWKLINSVMNQLHFYFTPNILYNSKNSTPTLGSFRMMNPYGQYAVSFGDADLEGIENKVPGYKSIIKSIGFKSQIRIPSVVKDVASSITDTMYQVYQPSKKEDYVLADKNNNDMVGDLTKSIPEFAEAPKYAYHKDIAFPPWLPGAIISANSLYTENTTIEGQSPNDTAATKVRETGALKATLDGISATLVAFIKSAMMIYGRINVTSTVRMIRLWSDCLNPLRIVLLDSGGLQQTTGLISRVSVKWVQGKSYDVSMGLSHVTDLRDPFFRALSGDLGLTHYDNLFKFTKAMNE